MKNASLFELHYYFGDQSHEIDALIRNKCEAEILGIFLEAANLLEIDVHLIKEAYQEGGFRDIWKALGQNDNQLTIVLLIIQIIISSIPLFGSDSKDLEMEERRLNIEEKKTEYRKTKKRNRNRQQARSHRNCCCISWLKSKNN